MHTSCYFRVRFKTSLNDFGLIIIFGRKKHAMVGNMLKDNVTFIDLFKNNEILFSSKKKYGE